jgi:hypothetical protein
MSGPKCMEIAYAPLAEARQCNRAQVDDGIHPALALRRAPREGMAGSAIVSAPFQRIPKPFLLGCFHPDRPVAVNPGAVRFRTSQAQSCSNQTNILEIRPKWRMGKMCCRWQYSRR